MLDLDSIAERCAKALNEQEDQWRNVFWGQDFQQVTQNMSDGEVEAMVSHCSSVRDCENLVMFLKTHPDSGSIPPYALIMLEAQRAGLSIRDWIRSLTKVA